MSHVNFSILGVTYTIPNSTNNAPLQIYPPSAITQQVQQSVPALNSIPPTAMQNRPDYNSMQRSQTPRASNSRTKMYINYLIFKLWKLINTAFNLSYMDYLFPCLLYNLNIYLQDDISIRITGDWTWYQPADC